MKFKKLMKFTNLLFYPRLDRMHRYKNLSSCNFYSVNDFQQKLEIEKRRVERLNLKTSIAIFKFSYLINNLIAYDKKKFGIEFFIEIICKNIRKTDVVYLYDPTTVVILLPETNSAGAQVMSERLLHRISNMLQTKFEMDWKINSDIEIDILSYPENLKENSMLKALTISEKQKKIDKPKEASSDRPTKEIEFKREFLRTNNICFSTNNGSTITSPLFDIFFWDQDLLIDLSKVIKKITKRAIDLFGAIFFLTFFAPFIIVFALLIKTTSSGKVIFKQDRIGYKGKFFTCYKFRTMKSNNQHTAHEEFVKKLIKGNDRDINTGSEDKPCYKIKNDPRITFIGKILRKSSLDELPQLWNVLKGDMSLVGPRPPVLYEVEEYKKWHYRRILEVKPGMTGLWQVEGRNRVNFDEMVRLDIRYAENYSMLLDIQILLKTILVVLKLNGQ